MLAAAGAKTGLSRQKANFSGRWQLSSTFTLPYSLIKPMDDYGERTHSRRDGKNLTCLSRRPAGIEREVKQIQSGPDRVQYTTSVVCLYFLAQAVGTAATRRGFVQP